MSRNPYAPKSAATQAPALWTATANREPVAGNRAFTPASVRRNGRLSASPIVASTGAINAHDKRELMANIGALVMAASQGNIVNQTEVAARQEAFANHREVLASAFNDKTGAGFTALGEVMSEQIVESLGRQGFIRRLLGFKALGQGEQNQIRVRVKDVRAFSASSNPQAISSEVIQEYYRPQEFYLLGNILMEEKEIQQDTGDLMDDKYNDGLEALMTQEDRIGLSVFNTAASAVNDEFTFTAFTPTTLQHMKSEITTQGGIPVNSMLISMDIWNDIVAEPEFQNWYSEIEKHELVLEGNLGQLAGMNIITDGYRIPTLKVLEQGQVYMFGIPETLGQIAQRGPLSVQSITKANDGIPKRGWFFQTIESISVVNARAIVRGQRG